MYKYQQHFFTDKKTIYAYKIHAPISLYDFICQHLGHHTWHTCHSHSYSFGRFWVKVLNQSETKDEWMQKNSKCAPSSSKQRDKKGFLCLRLCMSFTISLVILCISSIAQVIGWSRHFIVKVCCIIYLRSTTLRFQAKYFFMMMLAYVMYYLVGNTLNCLNSQEIKPTYRILHISLHMMRMLILLGYNWRKIEFLIPKIWGMKCLKT